MSDDDLERLSKILVMLESDLDRQAAANRFVAAARAAKIDLRDLRLKSTNGEDQVALAASELRVAEYERMMKMAYPGEAKLADEIATLKASNRQLRADLARKERDSVSAEAVRALQGELRDAKAMARHNATLLGAKLENSLLVTIFKRAITALRQPRDSGPMSREECVALIDAHKPPSMPMADALKMLSYVDGEVPSDIPMALRVALRAGKPPARSEGLTTTP